MAGPADPRSIGRVIGPLYAAFTGLITDRLRAETGGAIRAAHSPIFIYIEDEGSTLTELAAKARMTKPAMKELVDDLESSGYVVRRPNPKDGRAKLIFTTDRGERVIKRGRALIAEIEREWEKAIGKRRFADLKADLRRILEYEAAQSAVPPSVKEQRID
ncbi:MAG: winged helix-turn-helix transcriptional regulator [Candidatus Eremiobacteraeota bacterium]|nr:winged helix-turn-helix transcriptional regulator [Candidatus Eremiobacteraeota bacterium]MBV9972321.1 winged helix-turn-helix transcriptional regulator [Candidatus Eremiobacteraeota bacterium]